MRLSVQIEFDKTLDLETGKTEVVVGRSSSSDLIIPHESISRRHCQIKLSNKEFFICDLDSSNGVFINGERLKPGTLKKVPPEAQLSLGGLQCELSEYMPPAENTVVSTTIGRSGDYTATIRLARIDLNRPPIALELEKKQPKRKGPKNPVSAPKEPVEKSAGKSFFSRVFLFIAVALALALAWYLGG